MKSPPSVYPLSRHRTWCSLRATPSMERGCTCGFSPALPNGITLRTFEQEGLLISEVEFQIGDPGEYPRVVGYMVGENDGHSTLHPTVDNAIAAFRTPYSERGEGAR